MNRLILMCGLPGSGKSTYAKKLMEMNPGWKYVSRDEVRYEYVTDQAHYFDHETEVYKEFCNRIDMHLLNENTVIADATHLTLNSRKQLLQHLQVVPDEVYVCVLATPFEICLDRNAKREGITKVPQSAMFRMRSQFTFPNRFAEKYIDKIINVQEG